MKTTCEICFRHCRLDEGQTGFCRARFCSDDAVKPVAYGALTSLALDPIEKKPLYHFYPGSYILSAGGFGCNLNCPFCQNAEISLADGRSEIPGTKTLSPEELVDICVEYKNAGKLATEYRRGFRSESVKTGMFNEEPDRSDECIGLAFTYNEPLIHFEYVLDTAKLLRENDLKCVLVTNGSATADTLGKVLPWIDAMNIDLKSFNEDYYRNVLRGDLNTTKEFIEKAAAACHVEITTLIIPGENDSDEEMDEIASYISDIGNKNNKDIPLHISRFFPRSRYSDRAPTPVKTVYHLAERDRRQLKYVYEGNW